LEYVQNAGKQDDCFFCTAAASDDDEGWLVVHRGEQAFVLLNKFPYSSGHLLVAPYRHGANFGDLAEPEILEIHRPRRAGSRRARCGVQPAGLQPRLERRPPRWRGHPGPRTPARRATLGRRHELHACARRREVIPEHLLATRTKLAAAWPR